MNRTQINPSTIIHALSNQREGFRGHQGEIDEGTRRLGGCFSNHSPTCVKDFREGKSLIYIDIYILFINPSHVHAHARATRVCARMCTRGGGVKDLVASSRRIGSRVPVKSRVSSDEGAFRVRNDRRQHFLPVDDNNFCRCGFFLPSFFSSSTKSPEVTLFLRPSP